MKCKITILVLLHGTLCAVFEHDRAVLACQAGNYTKAHQFIQRALTEKPDDPALVYDAGIAAYKTGTMDEAQAYFSTVTRMPNVDQKLVEQAHFNWGNVHASRKEYKQAIDQYNRVLETDPDNERARHNKKIMEKLLEEQKKQQQQDEQNKKEQDKKDKNDKQQQDKQQQNKDNKGNNNNKGKQDTSQQQQSDTSGQDKHDQNQQDKKSGNDTQQKEKQQRDQTRQQQQQKEQDAAEQQKKDAQQTAQSNKQDGQKNEQQKQASEQQGKPISEKLDPKLARLLAEQEKHDAQLNKQLIKATVADKMGGGNGQNCW